MNTVLGKIEFQQFTEAEMERIRDSMDALNNCPVCGRKPLSRHDSGICYQCKAKEEKEMKKNHLLDLRFTPIEQRLSKIEEWIYDHSKKKHVEPNYVMR